MRTPLKHTVGLLPFKESENTAEFLVDDLASYVDLIVRIREHWDFETTDANTPWFRGHQRQNWYLRPTLSRIGCSDRQSDDQIRETFAIRAPGLSRFEAMPSNEWDMYFLMQHYGAPTRLLDWTEGPLIALFFALRDNPGYYDSAVWVLDPYELNDRTSEVAEIISPSALGVNDIDRVRAAPWLPSRFSKQVLPEGPLAVYPTHVAQRITSQKSCFTIHGSHEDGFEEFNRKGDPCLIKVIIPGHAVREIKSALQNFGVDETTIFPDLEGLGRALTAEHRNVSVPAPHNGVYARLMPSKLLSGKLGVFAISGIPRGTRIFGGENEEIAWIRSSDLPHNGPNREMYDEFAIVRGQFFGCPVSFNRITPAWFIANSEQPSTLCDENYDFFAARDIEPGEELTVAHDTFSESLPPEVE